MALGSGDPTSGIRNKPITDPGSGSRGRKGTGSRIRIRNTDLWFYSSIPWIDLIGRAMSVRANRALSLKVEVFLQVSDHVMLLPEHM
jgi:hypothetical protein